VNRDKTSAYAAAISAAVLMGSLGAFVRNVAADPAVIAFARLALGFAFLVGFLVFTRNLRAARVAISPSLVVSGLSIGLCVWSYTEAIARMSLASAVFFLYLGPLLAAGVAHLVLRETMTLQKFALMCVAFAGILCVFQFDFSFSRAHASGCAYGLLSALAYAGIIVANRKIPPRVSLLGRAFYQMLVATLALVPFMVWKGIHVSLQDLPWLVAVGFFQGFLALTLMIYAIGHSTAHEYGLLSYLEPFTATMIGVVVFAESLTPLQGLGGILIVSSGIVQLLGGKSERVSAGAHG
jgi:drug/metabolite transporter (DMT)-like permease